NNTPVNCDAVDMDYNFSLTADVDDGGGDDYFAIVMVDSNGTPLDVDFWYGSLGPVSSSDYTDLGLIYSTGARPVTLAMFDIGDPGAINENSQAGFDFATAGTLLAQTYLDPSTVATNGACDALPVQAPYLFGGAGGADVCRIQLPSGSVVGEAPLGAQVYWLPEVGKEAPGIILNPGTYWVVGVDETGEFSKIWLTCESTFWVRSEALQPSYLPPQNGAPLPTRIVG
ncbi:MAG: hypothetical protein KC519_21260, partial [Anaerolineae bacterium]|nr:hypothetical protein [Anaerolineae bacterium]